MSIPETKNIRFMRLGLSTMILVLMKLFMRIGKKFSIEKIYLKKKYKYRNRKCFYFYWVLYDYGIKKLETKPLEKLL